MTNIDTQRLPIGVFDSGVRWSIRFESSTGTISQ